MNFLNGYKTYIAAAGFGLLAMSHLMSGDINGAMPFVLQGLGLLGIRMAISEARAAVSAPTAPAAPSKP